VNLVDANVLIYAVDVHAEQHDPALTWLDRALSSREAVLMPWACLVSFVRIVTHRAIYPEPLPVAIAMDRVDDWLSASPVITDEPDRWHAGRLRQLLGATGSGGNLASDAHLAALALQYEATVVSYDNDFSRFPGVRWERPQVARGN
jgi:toxin-antitoxin system PIN domain toxin